ncbi:biofilm regulation protein phosphatase SiaA [Halomonas sabkhae]|uniref:biofilm regulation protein phosphatase SiaA n=1 Tax=Halomonas sabkhae TaxID=626223 RepID=UPI0025B5A7D8|nr:biofilm regulation protein phosphatase SiaA [Halomonas sabkhae]MDN3526050.1 biofilm regulation protein phosphatase SiaA [Halomonas sabkhae]
MKTFWGLRTKSTLALLTACVAALIPALLIAWQALDDVRRHFASGYAEQYTLLHMQRILTPISRDLALSRRLADSVVTREWLADPDDPRLRRRFFEEAGGYREQFSDDAYFIVEHASGDYHYNADQQDFSSAPRYQLSPDDPDDDWYYHTIQDPATYTIDVSQDHKLGVTKVWFNVKIRQDGELLGLTGGGIDLGSFLDRYMRDSPTGLTPMIIDKQGLIQAHPDRERVTVGTDDSLAGQDQTSRLHNLLDDPQQRDALDGILQKALRQPGNVRTLEASIQGRPHLLAVGYLQELDWMLVTAVDLRATPVINERWLWPMILGLLAVLGVLALVFMYASNRLILRPVQRLQRSARALADGGEHTPLPTSRQDEIGQLSRTFSYMAERIARHTQDLEERVQKRTQELMQANQEMQQARREIDASIEYASIIQRAILPNRRLAARLPDQHAVLWRPRDTVGGDVYVFHADDQGYLIGLVDCAGHGVPGALMTMLARAIIDNAILRHGPSDPAALLNETDRQIRATLHTGSQLNVIATHMDAGLVWIEPQASRLTFAGAKMTLYTTDGHQLEYHDGGKRALGQKRIMTYRNQALPLHHDWTYTLCTDGFLDQAGGEHGFGFGHSRLHDMLQRHASAPLDEQIAAYEAELEGYRGNLPQRDDITMLCFRFDASSTAYRQDASDTSRSNEKDAT